MRRQSQADQADPNVVVLGSRRDTSHADRRTHSDASHRAIFTAAAHDEGERPPLPERRPVAQQAPRRHERLVDHGYLPLVQPRPPVPCYHRLRAAPQAPQQRRRPQPLHRMVWRQPQLLRPDGLAPTPTPPAGTGPPRTPSPATPARLPLSRPHLPRSSASPSRRSPHRTARSRPVPSLATAAPRTPRTADVTAPGAAGTPSGGATTTAAGSPPAPPSIPNTPPVPRAYSPAPRCLATAGSAPPSARPIRVTLALGAPPP